jgi:hypothetical protein
MSAGDYRCPYCGHSHAYDGDFLEADELAEAACDSCDKAFVVRASYEVSYEASPADCLNGSPHRLKPISHPRVVNGKVRLTCEDCYYYDYRDATAEELAQHGDFRI